VDSLYETTRDAANFGAFVRPYTLDKKLEPGDVVETRLRLDLVKKADRYWWLWYALVHATLVLALFCWWWWW
jgi:hypothetical protein